MIVNHIDTFSRERVFSGDPDHFESDREFGRSVARTKIGETFLDQFEFSSNFDLIMKAVRTLYPDPNEPVTVSKFVNALDVVMRRPGKLVKRVVDESPAEETPAPPPVHRGQELWRSHAEFMRSGGQTGGEPTMDEVRAHARESASFRAYVQQAYRREMAQPIDGCEVLNRRTESPERKATPELQEFANTYHRLSCEEIRRLRRADSNPFGFKEWNKKFEACCEAGLI